MDAATKIDDADERIVGEMEGRWAGRSKEGPAHLPDLECSFFTHSIVITSLPKLVFWDIALWASAISRMG
jgi:hypothetical protein